MTGQALESSNKLADIPEDPLYRILGALDSASLARLGCTCSDLARRAQNSFLWEPRCRQRWKSQDSATWKRLASAGAYKDLYAEKHRLDQRARELTMDLAIEQHRPDVLLKLFNMSSDVLDALKNDATAPGDSSKQAIWAREALLHIQARLAADEMSALVYRSGSAPDALLDEGSMLLAKCHYPLSDLSAVTHFLNDMAAELLRRMRAANVSGGEAALKLLSALLFAPPSAASTDETDRYERCRQPADVVFRQWAAAEESLLEVPQNGESLNLRGNRTNYGDPGNSLIPAVLLTGRGIPLTLCIIHAAVGRRAGLNISGVNMPVHFINKWQEGKQELFIDCFNHGCIMHRNEVPLTLGPEVVLRLQAGYDRRIFNSAMPKDVWIRAISNMQNAYAGSMSHARETPPRGLALCNLLMCGILRTFTRQPYFVQQGLITDYVMSTWADGADLLPWALPGSLSLAPRDMTESLR